jgi:hypothetical protein
VRLWVYDHWTHRLRDGKKKNDGGRKEKWREKDETIVGCVACVCLSPETQVLRPRSWNPCPKTEVLKPRSWNRGPAGCPGFFLSLAFLADCPRLIPRFFFFCPFPAGSLCKRRTCSGLIPRFFFSSPFSSELPRVNTRVFFFFFSPFSGGLKVAGTH